MLSTFSTSGGNEKVETSESNSNSYPIRNAKKRQRQESSSSAARFKGVVPQSNGHWGAQIYANYQRIWLGTFKSEKEAAMAYDSAAIKLRSGDSHRNFPWTNLTVQEPNFQDHYSTEAILNMIKDGSYPLKFSEFLRVQSQIDESIEVGNSAPVRLHGNTDVVCRQLFQKELTPSDVGKLNRLVIPKKFATKHFPRISEDAEEIENETKVDDIQLVFYDRLMRSWKFRYCYWKSSQSYVFTRGWNRFVKEKELKAKDVVTFYMCQWRGGLQEGHTFWMIDFGYGGNPHVGIEIDLQLDLGQHFDDGSDKSGKDSMEEKVLLGLNSTSHEEKRGVRLFGVQIS